MYKSSNNKQVTLDNVNLKEEISNMKGIAIMLEQDDGTYKESSTNTFPIDMEFNYELSGCLDNLGNKIANSLTYENGIANVETSNTSYCYLYFDKPPIFLSEKIINIDTESDIGLQQEYIEVDDLYRFSGTNGNDGIYNYICLGTDSCVSGDDNMYRIIGVNPNNREVKVIKETPWNNGSTYAWHSSNVTTTKWKNSSLFTNVVSEIFDSLSFKDMIVQNHKWNVGSYDTSANPSSRLAVARGEKVDKIDANIGILSMTDYFLAYNGDRTWYSDYDTVSNWIGGYLNGNTSSYEWTMSHYQSYRTFAITNIGMQDYRQHSTNLYVIRPTMYLSGYVLYKSGDGTIDNPFIVELETERDNIENVTAEELINLGISEIWESTLEKDGYRYIGTNPNNYICFGTTSQSECMNNLDKYMYRIIGIFEDSSEEQHLKLIKKEALENYYTWNTDRETYKSWSGSTLFNGLNGNYFLSNTTYSYMQDSDWINKIVDWDYTATNTKPSDVAVAYYDGLKIKSIYLHEMNRDSKLSTTGTWTTVNAKIGAMYVSDYLLSLGEDVLTYTTYTNRSILNDGWMHLNENDYDAPNVNEWTMTRAGYNNSTQRYYMAWYISNGGYVDSDLVDSTYSVRPVFYLTSDVTISGEGTSTNPYIIS